MYEIVISFVIFWYLINPASKEIYLIVNFLMDAIKNISDVINRHYTLKKQFLFNQEQLEKKLKSLRSGKQVRKLKSNLSKIKISQKVNIF